jgi:AcrR family transcriptional regulator
MPEQAREPAPEPGPRERLLRAAVELLGRSGLGDRSLRAIADALGTSHRMLLYHFGSRAGLVAAVSLEVERQQRELVVSGYDTTSPAAMAGYWDQLVEATTRYGPLFFELAAQAAQHRPEAGEFAASMVADWLPPLTGLFRTLDLPTDEAGTYARLALAATRGLLLDLLVTGEREEVDAAQQLLGRLLTGPAPPP